MDRTTRWINVASAVALLSGALLHVVAGYSGGTSTSEHTLGTDDAYISYRYALNLSKGTVWCSIPASASRDSGISASS